MPGTRAPIRAVFFDLGRVLIDFDFEPAFRRLARHCPCTPRQIENYFLESGLEVLYDGGKISTAAFCRQVRRALGHRLDHGSFRRIWNDIFTPKPAMIRLALRLKKAGYRLALVSNTNAMHYAHLLRRYPFLRRFDARVPSFRVRVRKPDPRIYRRALALCRVRPEEVFYIDDRRDLTEAASSLGIRSHAFDGDRRRLERELRRCGLRY